MKKLLFLASFVFETGKIEYSDNQLVMVTDKDVQRFTENQKALNPDKGDRGPYDHYDACYDVFKAWFKEVYPESTLTHVMCKRPIQSDPYVQKDNALADLIDFGNYLLYRHGNVSYTSEAEYFDWRNNPNWKEMIQPRKPQIDNPSGLVFTNFYSVNDIPERSGKGADYSDYVMIDRNGFRDMDDFEIGYYDFSAKEWTLKHTKQKVDSVHMKWTKLPIDKR